MRLVSLGCAVLAYAAVSAWAVTDQAALNAVLKAAPNVSGGEAARIVVKLVLLNAGESVTVSVGDREVTFTIEGDVVKVVVPPAETALQQQGNGPPVWARLVLDEELFPQGKYWEETEASYSLAMAFAKDVREQVIGADRSSVQALLAADCFTLHNPDGNSITPETVTPETVLRRYGMGEVVTGTDGVTYNWYAGVGFGKAANETPYTSIIVSKALLNEGVVKAARAALEGAGVAPGADTAPAPAATAAPEDEGAEAEPQQGAEQPAAPATQGLLVQATAHAVEAIMVLNPAGGMGLESRSDADSELLIVRVVVPAGQLIMLSEFALETADKGKAWRVGVAGKDESWDFINPISFYYDTDRILLGGDPAGTAMVRLAFRLPRQHNGPLIVSFRGAQREVTLLTDPEWKLDCLTSDEKETRAEAASALGRLKGENGDRDAAIAALEKALPGEPDTEVRQKIQEALAELNAAAPQAAAVGTPRGTLKPLSLTRPRRNALDALKWCCENELLDIGGRAPRGLTTDEARKLLTEDALGQASYWVYVVAEEGGVESLVPYRGGLLGDEEVRGLADFVSACPENTVVMGAYEDSTGDVAASVYWYFGGSRASDADASPTLAKCLAEQADVDPSRPIYLRFLNDTRQLIVSFSRNIEVEPASVTLHPDWVKKD